MKNFIQKTEMTKQELIKKYRYVLVEDDFYFNDIIEIKKEEMQKIGFYNIDIKYLGFCSHGDGASITCEISLIDASKIINYMIQCKKYTEEVVFSIKRNTSRYYHENTLYIDNDYYCDDRLTEKAQNWIYSFIKDFENFLLDYVKTESSKLYKQLEAEYHHLTSDDIVFEYIIDNKAIFNIEEIK